MKKDRIMNIKSKLNVLLKLGFLTTIIFGCSTYQGNKMGKKKNNLGALNVEYINLRKLNAINSSLISLIDSLGKQFYCSNSNSIPYHADLYILEGKGVDSLRISINNEYDLLRDGFFRDDLRGGINCGESTIIVNCNSDQAFKKYFTLTKDSIAVPIYSLTYNATNILYKKCKNDYLYLSDVDILKLVIEKKTGVSLLEQMK